MLLLSPTPYPNGLTHTELQILGHLVDDSPPAHLAATTGPTHLAAHLASITTKLHAPSHRAATAVARHRGFHIPPQLTRATP